MALSGHVYLHNIEFYEMLTLGKISVHNAEETNLPSNNHCKSRKAKAVTKIQHFACSDDISQSMHMDHRKSVNSNQACRLLM